jgi:hypothetical protein
MYKYDRPSECLICSEDLNESIRPTKCGHYMHPECINKWLESNDKCPVCRTQLRNLDRIESSNELHFSLLIGGHSGNNEGENSNEMNQQIQDMLQHFVDFIRLQRQVN